MSKSNSLEARLKRGLKHSSTKIGYLPLALITGLMCYHLYCKEYNLAKPLAKINTTIAGVGLYHAYRIGRKEEGVIQNGS